MSGSETAGGNKMEMQSNDLMSLDCCPACRSGDLVPSETIKKPYWLTYMRCRACNLMFMNPMPSQAWYDEFYRHAFWEGKAAANRKNELSAQLYKEADRAHAIVEFMQGAQVSDGMVLEVGCAYGLLARSVAHRLGLEPAGIEPSDEARRFAEQHIRILGETAADLANIDANISLVILSNVLENIVDPETVLSTIRKRFGSYLIVVTPNPLRSRAVSLYHPFVYSAQAMERALLWTGFDVLRYSLDPEDPQAQMFFAAPSDGKLPLDLAQKFFVMRRKLGLYITKRKKRKKKRSLRLDDWDRQTIEKLLQS